MSSFRRSLTVRRVNAAGTYVKGEYVESGTSTIIILASVQPMKPDEMQLLEEGRRDSEAVRLYTDTKLLVANNDDKKNSDIVEINGSDYEVLNVATWQNDVINHYKVIAVKL